jgi:transcription termination factor Rho
VSLDSFDLEGLQRKDRAELATIAQHLGGKPGSRAKKADIIAMILELAGVTPPGDEPAEVEEAESPAAEQGVLEVDEPAEAAQAEQATDEQDAASGHDHSDGDEGSDADQAGSGGRDGQRERQDSQGQQGPQGQDRSQQSQADGEGEGSRRRRRRRGRDRDREGESEHQGPWEGDVIEVSGILDLRDEGYGFLRVDGLLPSRDDVYVSVKQTRQFGLRRGDLISGASRPANRGEKNPALLRIDKVNGLDPEESRDRPRFEDLTPLFPNEQLRLEREDHPYDVTGRIIDLLAPIGKGQRGLIVSPPKAGKTTVMKTIAQCIEANHPEVELMVLLVDERPEEVTDMRRSISGEVVASTFDRPAEEHIAVAELAIEQAKRVVEQGRDVVIILDGITRLARAYNLAAPTGGRIMSGGLDTAALYPPKRFFGAARNVEDGGSLTILATALVDTGSKMDEVIFEEFKGTGNMELRLDRRAAEKRVYPAIDVDGSSTRHEELLFDNKQLQQVWKLRRVLSALAGDGEPAAGLELVIDRMRKFPTNEVFLAEIAKAPAVN